MWVTLLGIVAALVPLAALDGSGASGVASAAPAVTQPTEGAAQAGPGAEAHREVARPASRQARPPTVDWRDSKALGTANAGSLVNGVQLPPEGPGYYTYNPTTQEPPGGADRTWGTATTIRELLDLGAWWERAHPGAPRLGIGDIAREHGGPFTGPVGRPRLSRERARR